MKPNKPVDTLRIEGACPICKRQIAILVPLPDRMKTADVIARWSDGILVDPRTGAIASVVESLGRTDVVLKLPGRPTPLTVPVEIGSFGVRDGTKQVSWGFIRLGPGVWKLTPSIQDGDFHGFLTIVAVPEPAPFALATLEVPR
jgi:hypothetical protein